jgi:hypothetical protein
MSKSTSAPPTATLAALALPAYVLAVLFMTMGPLDLMLDMPNFEFSSVRWRFGAVGLLVNGLLLPMTGLFLFLAIALLRGHRAAYIAGQVFAGIVVVALLVMFGSFALDSLQIRREVNPEMLRRFDATVVKTLALQLIQLGTILVIMLTSRRIAKSVFSKSDAARGGTLVVGAAR